MFLANGATSLLPHLADYEIHRKTFLVTAMVNSVFRTLHVVYIDLVLRIGMVVGLMLVSSH